jgi:uncharacterized protein (DUF1697 family)
MARWGEMPRYIAFLRAINVGGRTVKMDELRRLFQELGFSGVETFIASGNVIFEADAEEPGALERRIEAHLRQALGYEVGTFIRTPAELAQIAEYRPFPEADGSLYVLFLASEPDAAFRARVKEFETPVDLLHLHQRELYWLCRTKISESQVSGTLLGKALGVPATMRNANTIGRLAAKYPARTGGNPEGATEKQSGRRAQK